MDYLLTNSSVFSQIVMNLKNIYLWVQGSPDGEPFVPADDIDCYNQPVMTISLGGRRQTATVEQVTSLPLQQFAALWTVSRLLVISSGLFWAAA